MEAPDSDLYCRRHAVLCAAGAAGVLNPLGIFFVSAMFLRVSVDNTAGITYNKGAEKSAEDVPRRAREKRKLI